MTLKDDGRSRPAVRRWEETTTCRERDGRTGTPGRDDGRPRPHVRRWEEAMTLGGRGRDTGCEDNAATLCM